MVGYWNKNMMGKANPQERENSIVGIIPYMWYLYMYIYVYMYIHKCKFPQTLSAFNIDSPHTEYDVNNGATKNTLLLSIILVV